MSYTKIKEILSFVTAGEDPLTRILEQLKSSGALVKKTTPVYQCSDCELTFEDRTELHDHCVQHVKLPNVIIQRVDEGLDLDEEDEWDSGSDKSKEESNPMSQSNPTPQSNLLINKLGSGIKITSNKISTETSIESLKSIGVLSIKKINSNVQELIDESKSDALVKKIESSGTLKMTIKHSSDNKLFEVINGSNKEIKSENSLVNHGEGVENPDEWQPEDTKEGILNKYLNAPIKTESNVDEYSDTPEKSVAPLKVNVKSEATSRPGTPNEKTSTPSEGKDITVPKPMLIPKVEKEISAVIEINCDSDKDDDEIIFVSSSPVAEKKVTSAPPIIPSTTSQPLGHDHNTKSFPDKHHNFNWNAPTKGSGSIESLLADKNADALFESLLSNNRKDDSDLGTSEYISLDRLGPQHNCDFCNTRFTSLELLESHRRHTGHSNQLVSNLSSNKSMALSTYQPPGFLMNSLLPVEQLANTVSKIAVGNAATSGAFTHQQNIMVNIQSFPGQPPMGLQSHGPPPQPPYNYPGMPHPPYQSRFNMPNANVSYPNQYPGPYNNTYSYPQPPMPSFNPYPPHTMPQQFPQNQFFPQNPGQPIVQGQVGPGSNPNQLFPPASQNSMIPPTSSGHVTTSMPHHDHGDSNFDSTNGSAQNGIKIQGMQANGPQIKPLGPRLISKPDIRGPVLNIRGGARGGIRGPTIRPGVRPTIKMSGQAIRGMRPSMTRGQMKRPHPGNGSQQSPAKKRMDMLIPDKHDNEECEVTTSIRLFRMFFFIDV
jgi:hypothetical protein